MRVLVCGGRNYAEQDAVFHALTMIDQGQGIDWIIHGACPTGADAHAEAWALDWRPVQGWPADWAKYGRAAGPIRNAEMVRGSGADIVLAFPGGSGTADCVRQARAHGIEVIEMPADYWAWAAEAL